MVYLRKFFISFGIFATTAAGHFGAFAASDPIAQGIAATTYVDRAIDNALKDKQDVLTPGEHVSINDNVISVNGSSIARDIRVGGEYYKLASDLPAYADLGKSESNLGRYPSVGAAQKIAQGAVQNEIEAGQGITIQNSGTGIQISANIDTGLDKRSGNPVANAAVANKIEDIESRLNSTASAEKYIQSSEVKYDTIAPGSSGDGGQFPSLAAAKKIAQEAIKTEIKAGEGILINDETAGGSGIVIEVKGFHVDEKPDSDYYLASASSVYNELQKRQLVSNMVYSPQITDNYLQSMDSADNEYYPSVVATKAMVQKLIDTTGGTGITSQILPNGKVQINLDMRIWELIDSKQEKGTIPVGSATSSTNATIWVE